MLKTIGIIFLLFLLLIVFVTPVRNFMNNLIQRDKSELREEQIIGTVSGYNPRVEELQQVLKDAGFEPGPIDGIMGGHTRRAIREFQKTKGLKSTGKIDSSTQLALNREKEILRQTPKIDLDTSLSLEQTIPKGLKTEEAKVETEDTKKKAEIQDEVMSYRLKSKGRTMQIQTALKNAGFYKGEIDGKIGPQTKKAIKAFQKAKGLAPDGVVGPKTWEELEKYLKTR